MWKDLDFILAHGKPVNGESLTLRMAGLGGCLDRPDLVCTYLFIFIYFLMESREDIRA